MSENSAIEWTDHTFNPWWGCVRVSPACRFCYADTSAKRYGMQLWRKSGDRRMLSDENWRKPLKWNRNAEAEGVRKKVFCASMADVFEGRSDLDEPRARLWALIEQTPWLDWQLLTKRPENVAGMVPWGDDWPENVWLGVSVENTRFAQQRVPLLLESPARTRFLSCEPLLEPLDLTRIPSGSTMQPEMVWDVINRRYGVPGRWQAPMSRGIDWVILGGESGAKSRRTDEVWVRGLIEQCQGTQTAPFVKQLGTVWARQNGERGKGGDWSTWPEDLRIREFPQAVAA